MAYRQRCNFRLAVYSGLGHFLAEPHGYPRLVKKPHRYWFPSNIILFWSWLVGWLASFSCLLLPANQIWIAIESCSLAQSSSAGSASRYSPLSAFVSISLPLFRCTVYTRGLYIHPRKNIYHPFMSEGELLGWKAKRTSSDGVVPWQCARFEGARQRKRPYQRLLPSQPFVKFRDSVARSARLKRAQEEQTFFQKLALRLGEAGLPYTP